MPNGGIRNYWPATNNYWSLVSNGHTNVEKWSTCFFDVKFTQIATIIPRLFFEIWKCFTWLFVTVQSPDAMCKVLCELEKSTQMEPVDVVFWKAEVGVAYMGRCSNNSRMRGYDVFECATKYAGVISVTDFAQKQCHLVVFLVGDMKVTQRIYNFSPGPTTLPNKNSQMYTLRWSKSLAKFWKIIIIINEAISILFSDWMVEMG